MGTVEYLGAFVHHLSKGRSYDILNDAFTDNLLKYHFLRRIAFLWNTFLQAAGSGPFKLYTGLLTVCLTFKGQLIIFMIRKTTYFSKERDSMLELAKKSTESSDSRGEAEEPKLRFYQLFLEQQGTITCNISRVQKIPKMALERRYAVYCITIRTDVVQYQIKKRYSQFEKLYQRCLKHDKVNVAFPPRTIFQAGWSEEVTAFRMTQLNKFLEQISKCSASEPIKIQLYNFIHLYEEYQKQRVEGRETEGEILTDEFLLTEMVKLNENPTNILDSFDKIKLSISDRKKRLGFEVARNLFMGFDDYSGLLSISLASNNQLVVMGGLELLNWLISPQTHRDYEIFRRMLMKCLPNELVVQNYELLRSHCEITTEYFKLLKQYTSGRQDGDIQCVAKFYDSGESMEAEYERWLKFSNLDSRG